MVVPLLKVYSFAQFMMLAGYLLLCLGAATHALTAILSSRISQLWAGLAGLMTGLCLLAAFLLRLDPRWNGLVIGLSLLGGASMVLYGVLLWAHQKNLRASAPASVEASAPSGEVWPPPPTG